MNFGGISYTVCAFAFLALFLLLVSSWRGRLQGAIFVAAVASSLLWAALQAQYFARGETGLVRLYWVELVRDGLWLLFLLRLLSRRFLRVSKIGLSVVTAWSLLIAYWLLQIQATPTDPSLSSKIFAGFLGFSVLGLVMVEQLYRNTRLEKRWAIKFLCLGLAGLFVFDLYLYSSGLASQALDKVVWQARGFANALVVPLLAIAAARNPKWSLEVFVSRRVAFHTTMLISTAIYLSIIAITGLAIRNFGGDWGPVLQIVFLFGAGVLLAMILVSGNLRARVRVLLAKHFYNYKYDYRDEWLRLTSALAASQKQGDLKRRAIAAIAKIVECQSGALWQQKQNGRYQLTETWNLECANTEISVDDELLCFLAHRNWVLDLCEYAEEPKRYHGLETLPEWIAAIEGAWLVIPLALGSTMTGFVVLGQTRVPQVLNWEDNDILKTAGRQIASDMAQHDAAHALADARQFEAYSRVSAFIMHDLKNVLGQLSMVAQNAKKHKQNPEFVEDAFITIDNAVVRMSRLIRQLKSSAEQSEKQKLDIKALLDQVVAERSVVDPKPMFASNVKKIEVCGDQDKLISVLGNLIQNAQDASEADGSVEVSMQDSGEFVLITVEDKGQGMSGEFIRQQLFKPFVTTKGVMGMGIGACEAREYIDKLGGRLAVESEPGQGSKFQVWLPVIRESSENSFGQVA